MKIKLYKKRFAGFLRPINVVIICLLVVAFMLFVQVMGFYGNKPISAASAVTINGSADYAKTGIFSDLPISAEAVSLDNIDFSHRISTTPEQKRWVTVKMVVTAYCPCAKCCGRFSDGRTANRHKIGWKDRFVAAPKNIPFGTEMIIPGYNHNQPVKVKDRGRLIRGNRLDVFYNTHYTASKWGKRYLNVKIKM